MIGENWTRGFYGFSSSCQNIVSHIFRVFSINSFKYDSSRTTVMMYAHFHLYQGRKCDHIQVACSRISSARASRTCTIKGFGEASLLTAVTPWVSFHSWGSSSHSHQTGHHCRQSEEHLMPAVKIYSRSFVCASVKIRGFRKALKL